MIEQLKEKLLLSNRKEFIKFISNEYDFYNCKALKELKDKKINLSKLDLNSINHTLNRINSIKIFYDLSKGLPFLGTILVFFFTFIFKDYFQLMFTEEQLRSTSVTIGLFGIGFCGTFVLICLKIVENARHNNYLLSQFEGVLEDIKKHKEKKARTR